VVYTPDLRVRLFPGGLLAGSPSSNHSNHLQLACTFRRDFFLISNFPPLPAQLARVVLHFCMNWTPTAPISPRSGLRAGSPPTKDSTLFTILAECKFFGMNTCKTVSKQTTLTPFGMNTYEKSMGRGSYC
jgi:hypothetical protein